MDFRHRRCPNYERNPERWPTGASILYNSIILKLTITHDKQFQKTNPWFCSANQSGFVTMEKPPIEDDAAREPLACQENSCQGTHQPRWKVTPMLKAHSSCTFPNRCAKRHRYVSESVGLLAPPAARMAFAARSPDSIAGRMPSPLREYAKPAASPISSTPSPATFRLARPYRRYEWPAIFAGRSKATFRVFFRKAPKAAR